MVVKRLRLSRLEQLEFCKLPVLLWPATQAFCCTISLFPPLPAASVVKSTRARCAGQGSLEAPGTADPKLNIDGGQQVGDLRFSATGRSGAARQTTAASEGTAPLLCPGLGVSRDVSRRGGGGITTCSLAYSFCDGPSGGQVMPLLLADSISLTSLVNLDGHKGRLCHLSVIAWQCRWADGDDDEGIRGHSEVTTLDSKLFPDASRSCGATTKAARGCL